MTTAATANQRMGKNQAEASIDQPDQAPSTLNRLLGYMVGGDQRSRLILGVITRIVALLGLTALPFITGQAMNVINGPSGNLEQLYRWVLYGLVAGVIYLLFSFFSDRLFARMATHGLYKLQTTLFSNLQTLSMGFFFKNPPGELSSNITNDAEVVSLFYTSAVGQLIRAVLQIMMILIVMLVINWKLTIVALITVPFLLLAIYVITNIASPAFAKLQENLGEISGFQEETLAGRKVIISKRRQEWARETHEERAAEVYRVGRRAFFASLMQFPLTQTLAIFQNVFVLVAGTFMVIGGETTLGVVMSFSGYAAILASPLAQIATLITNALNAAAGGERVFKIIDEKPTIEDAPDAVEYEFKGGRIQCIDVDFSYVPGSKVLRHNTFDVQPGEKIGICGPTGAGKSTLINILTRYYEIDSGTILIDGQNLQQLTQESLRKQIGVVLQEAFLFTDTVMNNLKYANADATEEDCIDAAKKANAHDFIMELPQGYDTLLTERGANLSQGQRQMITIARAMVADPKMLILDEATSNVDTRTEKLIQDGMRNLMEGKTSFSIAHRLATIRDSNNIMVLNGGEIVEYAPHDELMADKGFYYALYMSQFKGKAPGGAAAADVDFVST
jgi:ABC-type multidrug transport system fused ATPase/permease subunit